MEDLVECIPSFARGLQILVVDHDTTSLLEIAWVLEQFAFKVTTTEMGSVALSMIEAERETPFNIVIVNVHMLDISILEFIRILFKKNIPVVLIAASEHTQMALRGLNEGASFFYEKPVSMDELRHVWQSFYRRKKNLTKLGSNMGAGQGRREKYGRKPTNFKLEEHGGSAKVPKMRGRKPKNKETEMEVPEVVDVGAGYQEAADDPKGKRKVYEEEVQAMSTSNDFQNKKIRANSFNGSGDLQVFNDPKGKLMQDEEGVLRLIEVDDEPKETPNAGIGQIIKENSGNKDREVGIMEREEIISMSEFVKENAKKDMRDKIMSIAGEKRNRIVWTKELHLKFTQAVSLLGDDKAVPKTILEIMNVPYLNHRQVASHLQKYKNQIKQMSNTATPTSPTRPKSSSLNISRFQQVPEMTNAQGHEHIQGGWNLGDDITQSQRKPVAMHNSTFSDARLSYNERLQLASSYINAQNQNRTSQEMDIMSANVFSRNQVPLPTQGLDAITGNVTSGNQLLMPIQGLNVMPGHVSPKKSSIPEKYLINFTEENKDLPATNVPAAPPSGPENQQQQSLDDYYDILNSKILDSWDMDQYLDG